MKFTKSILFAIGLIISVCTAQNYSISGIVTDSGGVPIEGAIVRLEKGSLSDTTEFDGSFLLKNTSIKAHPNVIFQQSTKLRMQIKNGILYIHTRERMKVEIVGYNIQGRTIVSSTIMRDGGTQLINLYSLGAGIYLYKIMAGGNEYLLKCTSLKNQANMMLVSAQRRQTSALAKQAAATPAINDVIAVTKGVCEYLDYRVIVTNSDTSNIEIKMLPCADTARDVDGNLYQAVRIGTQVWTVTNLQAVKFNDGSVIPHVVDSIEWNERTTPAYCYYKNTANADSIARYGAMYNWHAVNTGKLAPVGWHVPTEAEFDTMGNYLITHGYNWDGTADSNRVGKSVASKADWNADTVIGHIGKDLRTNNSTGFSALPGGFRYTDASFWHIGNAGLWWSTSVSQQDSTKAMYGFSIYNNEGFYKFHRHKSCGYSIRLLRDN